MIGLPNADEETVARSLRILRFLQSRLAAPLHDETPVSLCDKSCHPFDRVAPIIERDMDLHHKHDNARISLRAGSTIRPSANVFLSRLVTRS